MRKLIVVLMAVLMLVSFTSCNQDKIDELEKKVAQNEADKETFTEFVDAFQSVMAIKNAYDDVLFDKYAKDDKLRTSPITLHEHENDDTKDVFPNFMSGDYNIWLSQQALIKNPKITDWEFDKENTSGTVTYEGTLTVDNLNYKIVNNVIAVKYSLDDSGDYLEEPIKLDIDGSLSCKTSTDSGLGTATVAFNGTICGKEINLSFVATTSNTEYLKFTAAEINGKTVDLVLLNNVAAGMIPIETLYLLFRA